ncbi:MAG: hypothetical protein A2V69_01065 [Candidatus Portnoybacteria bacterium RBG_13_40_8]|uniref:RNA polymerase sigma-70 region 4 domain-containing protein n=1 Tax=Candidatus Portnoybacteria bacterium RBG_13_40_8 TaxID=1801990 RepID=A0A1G2F2N1_9BACT|nr:MAG: hypothetical protein A2V69_01065 [Candidatus Portnoybacteria bacterium RBG_13_40_8]
MNDLEIKELTDIFDKVKRNTILALRMKGLSLNEIVRRLGGTTKPVIKRIIDEVKKEEKL